MTIIPAYRWSGSSELDGSIRKHQISMARTGSQYACCDIRTVLSQVLPLITRRGPVVYVCLSKKPAT